MTSLLEFGSALLRVVYSSIVASVVVTGLFAVAILTLVRAAELRRDGRAATAAVCTLTALFALAVCAGAMVFGLLVVGARH